MLYSGDYDFYERERAIRETNQQAAFARQQSMLAKENRFIEKHGMREYAKWYLGIDDEEDQDNKGRYKFPYGDFANVHRCGVLAAESRAGQYKHFDIERAASHLHGMLEERREVRA